MKAQKGANRTTREIDDKNSTQKQFISSQAFHRTPGGRVRGTIVGEQLRPQSSRLLIRWLKSTPGIQPATDFSQMETTT
jgi:hypothetical protein